MKYIGIDEAGRGPVVGPMIIAGIQIEEKDLDGLKSLGVKDSKMLSIKKIFEIGEFLLKEFNNKIIEVWPEEIDKNENLNNLELEKFVEIINSLEGEVAIVDAPSNNPKKIEEIIKSKCNKKIIAENYADKNYLQVGAASIIAKMKREQIISKLKEELNIDFGSGYPSDEKTKLFILKIIKEGKINEYRKIIRKSWITIQPKLTYY
ncbi:MAG: ribonuclease HII [Candidatus Rehaiarchaeum fermentans]|nr:ribonuclease HII [Candidatus Rehaiarchaeum fermentans]MCW1297269.1 ribonuclease HII [Candidatus Rehaiarchaeum fermentans]